jgi:hypothetical protein
MSALAWQISAGQCVGKGIQRNPLNKILVKCDLGIPQNRILVTAIDGIPVNRSFEGRKIF